MLIDTHCHLNMIVKEKFDTPLTQNEINAAESIIDDAQKHDVSTIINVGTSLVESKNCIVIAQKYSNVHAAVGIHPNDGTDQWRNEIEKIKTILKKDTEKKIVGIGECGLDRHYPGYNIVRQRDLFKAQIDLSLEYNRALIVHTRDAGDETLRVLEEYAGQITRGIIHCFSEDLNFAQTAIGWNFALGIGGTITYPKNNTLREIVQTVGIKNIVLETDAPFLPPQVIRGKKNYPLHIKTVATYIADMLDMPYADVAHITSKHAQKIFNLKN